MAEVYCQNRRLEYDPAVNISAIGVLVKDGAVTLNGFVTNYGEKWNAVSATKRVVGVRRGGTGGQQPPA